MKITAVVNTYNEETNISRCLDSVKNLADEMVMVDMHSTDKTVEIAKKYTDKIYFHEYTRYVEPARNFALSKATGDWIILIDADEELSNQLVRQLKKIAKDDHFDFVEIPRKNIIFNQWIEHSRWWPDYLIRFFRRGAVNFSNQIHQPPQTRGKGIKLEATEGNALIHYHYSSISQYLERLNRYSDIQAIHLREQKYTFRWQDIVIKPADEFISRYFSGDGYKDGLHGLVLALLQAFSELVVYIKVWEANDFSQSRIEEAEEVITEQFNKFLFWRIKKTPSIINRVLLKIKRKL